MAHFGLSYPVIMNSLTHGCRLLSKSGMRKKEQGGNSRNAKLQQEFTVTPEMEYRDVYQQFFDMLIKR